MKAGNPLLLFGLLALLFSTHPANAKEESVAISLGIMDFHYEETDLDGTFLDGEYGEIPGFSVEYTRKFRSNMLARFSLEYYRGTVDYDGHLLSREDPIDLNVHMFPYQSETEETVFTLSAYLSQQISQSLPLSIYGKFSYKNWGRDIQGRYVSEQGNLGIPINEFVPALYEEYSWWQVNGGLHYQLNIASASRLELFGGFLYTLDATMEVGPYELNLGEELGYEAGITYYYQFSPGKRLAVSSMLSYWEFGRSNFIPTGPNEVIWEPDSESRMTTFKVTYEWDLLRR